MTMRVKLDRTSTPSRDHSALRQSFVFAQDRLGRQGHGGLYGWLLFAVCSLGIAGSLAFLVAMTRTPAIRLLPNARSFYVLLVGHVTFALIIWGLSFITALWSYAGSCCGPSRPKTRFAGGWRLLPALFGAGLILASVLAGQGVPRLNDYVPVLETPLFVVGYTLFVAGVMITLVHFLATVVRRPRPRAVLGADSGDQPGGGRDGASAGFLDQVQVFGLASAAICVLLAAAALAVALVRIVPRHDPATGPFPYQALFWGAGHALQYAYVAAMVVSWQVLAATLGVPLISRPMARAAFALYPLFALPAPFLYLLVEPARLPSHTMASVVLGAGLSVPTLLHILLLAHAGRRSRVRIADLKSRPEALALGFSLLLYSIGSFLEPSGAGGTLRVPAHYHGVVVGGMTIAFMGLAYRLLPEVGRALHSRRLARWQLVLYGLGILVLVITLAWAGALGAPRKAFDVAADTTRPAWLLPMGLMGVGAVLAVAGGAGFVANVLLSLLKRPAAEGSEIRNVALSLPREPALSLSKGPKSEVL